VYYRSTREAVPSGPPVQVKQKTHALSFKSCALTSSTGEGVHTVDEERALTFTWVLDEGRLAVNKGYKLFEIYGVYDYHVAQYNPESGEGGLFVDYIYTFWSLKSVASGYHGWV